MQQDDDERKFKPRKRPLKRGAGSANFQMAFVRRSSTMDPNLSYVVETSNDMVSWTSAGVTEVFTKTIDGGMEFVIYKVDKAFTDADAPRNQFMRLNVTTSE